MSFEMIKLIARILIILLTFFQVSIIPVSANPIIFVQDHHSGISEVYTYDGIENSVWEKADLTDGLSQFLSAKVVRLDHEVFAGVVSVAARTSTASWGKVFNYRHGGQMSVIEHIMYRHSYNTGFSNVSRFAQGTNARMIKGYVDQAVKHGTPIKGGFEYNFGRVIGTGANGTPASSIRVYVRDGWVRTAFPF